MRGRRARLIAAMSLTIVAGFVASAAPPAVDYVYPAGGRRGTTFTVTLGQKGRGGAKLDPWPAKVWIDCPGVEFTPQAANGTFGVKVAPDAPAGPHVVRAYNAEGASAPRVFFIGRHAEPVEQEPNDDSAKPQLIDAQPATINGRLEKAGDVDSFAVDVEAGRWLVAELACWRLGSPVDPALRLLDPDGNEVAFNHDTFGFDPLAAHRAAKSGRYVVQVVGFDDPPSVNVGFSGSKAAVYRLLLTTGPYARYSLPLGVWRGAGGTAAAATALRLFGWNLGGAGGRELSLPFDAGTLPPHAEQTLLNVPQIDNALPLQLGDAPETVAADEGAALGLPAAVTGRIEHPGAAGRLSFKASKGQKLTFATSAGPALGLPLDPVVTIADAGGKRLARADQGEGSPRTPLEWTAPADGTYRASVADRNHGGGEDFVYRLAIEPVTPEFRATLGDDAVRLAAGKSAEVKVTVARRGGHAAPLAVVLTGLPEGVTATTAGASTGTGAGAFTVTLTAKPTAAAANQPVRVTVVSADEHHPDARPAAFDLPAGSIVRNVPSLWLTVIPAPPATQPTTKPAGPK